MKFGSRTAIDITLAGLVSGSAVQSAMISNAIGANVVIVSGRITTGTTPVAGRSIQFYLINGDGVQRADGATAAKGAITLVTARGEAGFATDGTSDKAYNFCFPLRLWVPEWAIAVSQDTGADLNATAGLHFMHYRYVK